MVIPTEVLNTSKHAKTEIEKREKIETEHVEMKKKWLNQAPFHQCQWIGYRWNKKETKA